MMRKRLLQTKYRRNRLLYKVFYTNNCAPQREEELDLLILGQQTYQELLDEGTEVGLDTVLDLNIK